MALGALALFCPAGWGNGFMAAGFVFITLATVAGSPFSTSAVAAADGGDMEAYQISIPAATAPQ